MTRGRLAACALRRTLSLLACGLQVGVACAQLRAYDTGFAVVPQHFCDTIPIEFKDDQVYLAARVEGRTLRLNLDTGAGQGVVFEGSPLARGRELGRVVSRDANGRQDTVRVVELPPLHIGGLTLTGYVASVQPRPAVATRYDGILGFDLVNKGLCAKLDTRAGHLILTDRKDFFDAEAGFAVKYKLKWFVPYLYVSPFVRHTDEALFDTGTRPLYTMNKASFDRHAYKSKQVEAQVEGRTTGRKAIALQGAEREAEVAFLHLDRLKWGDFAFTDLRTVTTQGASRIGAQLLRHGSVAINPRRRRIAFQPYEDGDSVRIGNRHHATSYVPIDGRAGVGLVWEGSDAYKAGLRPGDIVLRIDGQSIPTFEAFARHPFVEGRTYTFLLRDDRGFQKEVTLTR